jgi:hypothetical protein
MRADDFSPVPSPASALMQASSADVAVVLASNTEPKNRTRVAAFWFPSFCMSGRERKKAEAEGSREGQGGNDAEVEGKNEAEKEEVKALDVATASVFQLFAQLTVLEVEPRLQAAGELVRRVQRAQAAHGTADGLHAETDYIVKRLIRGIASATDAARQGYALVLAEVRSVPRACRPCRPLVQCGKCWKDCLPLDGRFAYR